MTCIHFYPFFTFAHGLSIIRQTCQPFPNSQAAFHHIREMPAWANSAWHSCASSTVEETRHNEKDIKRQIQIFKF